MDIAQPEAGRRAEPARWVGPAGAAALPLCPPCRHVRAGSPGRPMLQAGSLHSHAVQVSSAGARLPRLLRRNRRLHRQPHWWLRAAASWRGALGGQQLVLGRGVQHVAQLQPQPHQHLAHHAAALRGAHRAAAAAARAAVACRRRRGRGGRHTRERIGCTACTKAGGTLRRCSWPARTCRRRRQVGGPSAARGARCAACCTAALPLCQQLQDGGFQRGGAGAGQVSPIAAGGRARRSCCVYQGRGGWQRGGGAPQLPGAPCPAPAAAAWQATSGRCGAQHKKAHMRPSRPTRNLV